MNPLSRANPLKSGNGLGPQRRFPHTRDQDPVHAQRCGLKRRFRWTRRHWPLGAFPGSSHQTSTSKDKRHVHTNITKAGPASTSIGSSLLNLSHAHGINDCTSGMHAVVGMREPFTCSGFREVPLIDGGRFLANKVIHHICQNRY